MITINEEKCVRCFKCVTVCPFKVMTVIDGKPGLNPKKKCIDCLHCAAACPQDAVLADGGPAITGEAPAALSEDFSQDLTAFLKTRRSFRHFKPEPVDEALIREALALADWAPSAKNQHPAGWVVVNDKKQIDQIMDHILAFVADTGTSPEISAEYANGNNVFTGEAHTLILAHADPAAVNAPVDCALALHTAELFLQSCGVGACWSGYLTRMSNNVPALRELYALPEGHQFFCALMAGYPQNEAYLHLPVRMKAANVRFL